MPHIPTLASEQTQSPNIQTFSNEMLQPSASPNRPRNTHRGALDCRVPSPLETSREPEMGSGASSAKISTHAHRYLYIYIYIHIFIHIKPPFKTPRSAETQHHTWQRLQIHNHETQYFSSPQQIPDRVFLLED